LLDNAFKSVSLVRKGRGGKRRLKSCKNDAEKGKKTKRLGYALKVESLFSKGWWGVGGVGWKKILLRL